MKRVTGSIATNLVGSRCHFEFEIEDDATPAEIEEMARDAAFDLVDWGYTVEEVKP